MSSASSLVIRPRRPRGHRCVGVPIPYIPVKEPLAVLIGIVKADAEVRSVDASTPMTLTARHVRSIPDGFGDDDDSYNSIYCVATVARVHSMGQRGSRPTAKTAKPKPPPISRSMVPPPQLLKIGPATTHTTINRKTRSSF